MQRIYLLKGKVQHYDWGGFDFIPGLLDINNTERKPYAEYWLGAHESHPSTIIGTDQLEKTLIKAIDENRLAFLGEVISQKFDRLPFLLKVLDVKDMLSIQVHPDRLQAIEGYTRENQRGVDLAAVDRNYRDSRHKPELMVALSDFWLLHGFKPLPQFSSVLKRVPELNFLSELLENSGIEGLYTQVMTMEQKEINRVLSSLAERVVPLYEAKELEKDDESYWAAKAILNFCKDRDFDRGIFSIYFFNLLKLEKGEGIYQKPGMLHAYLEGQNVELMANSDNVIRAGLTTKHIDVDELLKLVRFEPTSPHILQFSSGKRISPAEEFSLGQLSLHHEKKHCITESAEILLVMEGEVEIVAEEVKLNLKKGMSAFITANTGYLIFPHSKSIVYKASVPKV